MEITNITVDGDLTNISKPDKKGFYTLNEYVVVLIEFKDGKLILATAKKGYKWDKASIPPVFEWFVKPDEPWIELASLVHDIFFNWEETTCDYAADVMYEMMKYYIDRNYKRSFKRLMIRIKSRIVKRAVDGFIAERLFDKPDDTDLYNRNYSSIDIF